MSVNTFLSLWLLLWGLPMNTGNRVEVTRPGVTIAIVPTGAEPAAAIKPLLLSLEPGGELYSNDFAPIDEKDLVSLLNGISQRPVLLMLRITDPLHTSVLVLADRLRAITNAANPLNSTIIHIEVDINRRGK